MTALWTEAELTGLFHIVPHILTVFVGETIFYAVIAGQIGTGFRRSDDIINSQTIFRMG